MVARFDGGRLSSEGGLLALREIERRLDVADRLAACLEDPREPDRTVHRVAEIIRFRMLMIAAGLRGRQRRRRAARDPMFKLALDRLPSGEELCSQSTISRLENLPDRASAAAPGRALVEQYCALVPRRCPKRIVLDIDDTFDRVHGGQQLRLFNAYYDDYGFQPIVVFDGEGRFVTALLRPASGRAGWRSAPFCAAWSAPSAPIGPRSRSCCAPTAIMRARKCSTGAAPTGSIGSSVWPPPARCAAMSRRWRRAPPSASRRRRRAARCGASAQFHDAAAELEPGRAHHRPRRGRARGHRHPLHRHQPRRRPRQARSTRALLRARSGREPHQGVEEPPRRRPHLLPRGRRQPVSPVPARRRLLAVVVDAPLMPKRLGLAASCSSTPCGCA